MWFWSQMTKDMFLAELSLFWFTIPLQSTLSLKNANLSTLLIKGFIASQKAHDVSALSMKGYLTLIRCQNIICLACQWFYFTTLFHSCRMLEPSDLIREAILSTLPKIPVKSLSCMVEKLIQQGVETEEDLQYVREDDIQEFMKPIQCRKLLDAWKCKGNWGFKYKSCFLVLKLHYITLWH